MRSATGQAVLATRIDVGRMRMDAVRAVERALLTAYEAADTAGYHVRVVSAHDLLRQWHTLSNERVVVPCGRPLILTFTRDADMRPALLICREAIARYPRDLAGGRKLCAVIAQVAAFAPNAALSGVGLACDVGASVRWTYAVRAGEMPTTASA